MDKADDNDKTGEIIFDDILKSVEDDLSEGKDTGSDDEYEHELEIEEGPEEDEEPEDDLEDYHEDDPDEEEEIQQRQEQQTQQQRQQQREKFIQTKTITLVKKHPTKTTTPSSSVTKGLSQQPTILNNMMQNKNVASSSGFIKIAPRSTTTTVVTSSSPSSSINTMSKNSNGKIIYLQRPGGKTVPVRVPTSIASNAQANNQTKQTVAIHVMRTPEGNFVPVKTGKGLNYPNSMMGGNKLIPTSSGGKILMKAQVRTPPNSVAPSGSRSIGSTIISSVEPKTKSRPVMAARQVIRNPNNGGGAGKVLVHGTPGQPRQVMVSGNMIKLSPNTSGGQLQAVQIPGKPGFQYVRVLNSSQGGMTQHKVASSDPSTTHKYTVVNQPNKQSIVVKSPLTDRDRQIKMTTVPTFRKINDVIMRTSETGVSNLVRTQKISQINSQIGRFCSTSNATSQSKTDTSPNKCYVVSNSSLIRNSVASHNQKIMQQRQSIIESRTDASAANSKSSPPPAKKLYSILRPTIAETQHVKIEAKAEPMPSKQKAEPFISKYNKPSTNLSASTAGARLSLMAASTSRTSPAPSDDSNTVTIRRKHCNCTKSQCLKLYCDCFANGEFCQDCNCKDCLNNLDNEDERQKAIKICLERNPNSFKPKITAAANESDQRLHNKGCNCKRSGCLKNYCECYEAKIPCSSNCKCIGCRNVDDHPDLDMDTKKCPIPTNTTSNRGKRTYEMIEMTKPRAPSSSASTASAAVAATTAATVSGPPAEKQPCNFITQEVVDATIQCLIAQADECEKGDLSPYQTEKMVMEELGRCLVEIIDFSIRNTD